ncbi:hypothetical protein IP88_09895 [alpha proteobacterium AAP81b]|nr:hypothetical protein IP88_09895 [alpha proteobacterium AAP81b]
MATVNVSLPDPLRDYVEARAAAGSYSTSEYIRHLIREDQARHAEAERDLLWELLAVSARQLDEGQGVAFDVDAIIADRRRRHAA